MLVVLCLGLRLWTAVKWPYRHETHLFPTHLRIDALAIGVLLAYGWYVQSWFRAATITLARWPLAIAGVALLCPAFVIDLGTSIWMPAIAVTGFSIGAACLLLVALHTPDTGSRVIRLIGQIGVYSYSVYLWHMLVERIIAALRLPWPIYAASYLVLAVLTGIGMSRAIEYPVLRLRERWFPVHDRERLGITTSLPMVASI